MSHMSQPFYFKLFYFKHPSLPSPLHPLRSLLPFMQGLSDPFNVKPALPPPCLVFLLSPRRCCVSVRLPVCLFVSPLMACVSHFASLCPSQPPVSPCALCPYNICFVWHPVSELLQVLSTSSRVRMDIEKSSRHLSLSPVLSLNTAANPSLIPSLQLAHLIPLCVYTAAEIDEKSVGKNVCASFNSKKMNPYMTSEKFLKLV